MKNNIYILLLFLLLFSPCSPVIAKQNPHAKAKPVVSYQTTIYTDKTLSDELKKSSTRGFGSELVASLGNAAIGVTTGYISSIADFGIQAIGQLIMLDRKHKQEWQEMVKKECVVTDNIGTLCAINDFYASGSEQGALDPTGMQFNGLGCLAKMGEDTSFYISCHIDRQKLHRLVNHSKFELVLDTIVISPYHSQLPNSSYPIPFSFAERKIFNFKMTIQILSSWMDFTSTLHKDEVLGDFVLNIPIDSTDVNEKGYFVYIRPQGQPVKYSLVGESFIVPRSYIQFIDENDNMLHEYYGTGQYSLKIMIEEMCEISPEYQKNWRKDRKKRQNMAHAKHKKQSFDDVCRTVTHQTWDESLQAWIVTILKAPIDYSIKTLDGQMRLPSEQQPSNGAQQPSSNGQQQAPNNTKKPD